MRTAVLVLLLAVLSGAAVYEISNGFCVLRYDTQKSSFENAEKCNDGNGFYMNCHFSHRNRNGAKKVQFYFSPKELARPPVNVDSGTSYGLEDFSSDISVGLFGFCQAVFDMNIEKVSK